MKKVVYLNESQLRDIIEKVVRETQKEMEEDIDPSELEIGKSYEYPHPDPEQRGPMEYEGSFDDFESLHPNSKIYKFKKGKGGAIFTDVTPIQKYEA